MIKVIKINDIHDADVELYNERSETKLYRANEPEPGYFVAESSKCVIRALEDNYVPKSMLIEDNILAKYEAFKKENVSADCKMLKMVDDMADLIPVYVLSHEKMIETTGYNITGGVLSLMCRRPIKSLDKILLGFSNNSEVKIVVLDDVENPTNVGAIIRCAAALNADMILLTSDCADPLYRRSARVSMGTVFQIPWTIVDKNCDYIGVLKKAGFKTAAMALTEKSVDIDDKKLNKENRLAIIMGNEGNGLALGKIEACDYTVCIPMSHGVDSLNVAAASAVAIWQLCR